MDSDDGEHNDYDFGVELGHNDYDSDDELGHDDILLADPDVFGAHDPQALLSALIAMAGAAGNFRSASDDDDIYNARVEFAEEFESRMALRRETWTWFDIDWSKDSGYYDPVEDWDYGDMISYPPPECNTDPRPVLHDRRWTDLKIRDRGKELCTGEPQPEDFASWSLGAIYQRMTDIDELMFHIKDIWPVKMFKLNSVRASAIVALKDAPPSHHVELAKRLLLEHNMLRKITLERSRSSIRPLSLLDVPLEILGLVAQYLDGNDNEDPKQVDKPYTARGYHDIQSLRLTCQTLNSASSPALLHCVTVQMTKSSLDRFKYIAERPHFRNGIKRVRISLGYFCAKIAASPLNFTSYAVWMLEFALYRKDQRGESILDAITVYNEDSKPRYQQLQDLLTSWKDLRDTPRDGVDGEQRWLALFRQQHALVEMYEAYRHSSKEYESVRQTFVHEVIDVLSQMPRLTRLEISDYLWRSENNSTVCQDLEQALVRDENFMRGDRYVGLFTKPMQWDRLAGFSPMGSDSFETSPPVDVIGQLFVLLSRRGVQLTKVDINITSPPDFEALRPANAETRQEIVKLFQTVWFLRFKIRPLADFRNHDPELLADDDADHIWEPRSEKELEALDVFLDALLDTKSLKQLTLDFLALMYEKYFNFSDTNWYLPSIMKPRQWARPLLLEFNAVCIDSTRLNSFIGDGPMHFRQFKNIFMARGTWTEALDVMRENYDLSDEDAPKTSFTTTFSLSNLRGAEVDHMDDVEQQDAFEDTFSSRPSALHAHAYINHRTDDNPFRPFEQHVV
ncbi:hypothetical protein CcaCcLH18_10154 [Colletotrichum camelliae]|nr:hypothetical protein CcaCcLH18_10154 [Colletotrichum camelliae]